MNAFWVQKPHTAAAVAVTSSQRFGAEPLAEDEENSVIG
jgi:hypothetical protein